MINAHFELSDIFRCWIQWCDVCSG